LKSVCPGFADRREDLQILERFMWKSTQSSMGKRSMASRAGTKLPFPPFWPGNVRELENVLSLGRDDGQDNLIDLKTCPSRF